MKALSFLALLAPTFGAACLNDRDTLEFELRNVDALHRITNETDVEKKGAAIQELALRAIGGRFERYPDLYYQMRIARLLNKPKLTAAEYDDLAVAYDRLGKVDAAIRTILDSGNLRKSEDDKYRFHANYGTFLVHRWIINGHKATDVATLKQSIEEIQSALKINPKSHFGREGVQLELEKTWMPGDQHWFGHGNDALTDEDTIVGLSGIVMMGLGYELPDVYGLMSERRVPSQAGRSLLQSFAELRETELIRQGKTLLDPHQIKPIDEYSDGKAEYRRLREDGERVYQDRLAYMKPRLARGEHPDTDPSFWAGWKEPPQPVLNPVPSQSDAYYLYIAAWLLVGVIALAIVWLWRRRRKRRMAA